MVLLSQNRRDVTSSVLRETVSFAARWGGPSIVVRHSIASRRASILVYHDPAPAVLERHLAYLSKRYAFVTLDALVDAIRFDRWATMPPRALVLTFDDGLRGNFELLEVLERYRVVPTIFLCSQIVATSRHYWFRDAADVERLKRLPHRERLARLERDHGFSPLVAHAAEDRQALSAEEVEAMIDRVDFGSHTRFHPVLTTCTDAEAEAEIVESKIDVERLLGRSCRHFNYPNGDYTEREIELVRRAGYDSARTVDFGWNGSRTDVFRLRILGTMDDASLNRLAADLSGVAGCVAHLRRGIVGRRRRPIIAR